MICWKLGRESSDSSLAKSCASRQLVWWTSACLEKDRLFVIGDRRGGDKFEGLNMRSNVHNRIVLGAGADSQAEADHQETRVPRVQSSCPITWVCIIREHLEARRGAPQEECPRWSSWPYDSPIVQGRQPSYVISAVTWFRQSHDFSKGSTTRRVSKTELMGVWQS